MKAIEEKYVKKEPNDLGFKNYTNEKFNMPEEEAYIPSPHSKKSYSSRKPQNVDLEE